MKKIALLTAMLVVIAASAFAQVPSKPFSIYVGGGLSFPVSPDSTFKTLYKTGYHGLVGLGFGTMPIMQFVAKAELHSFSADASDLGNFTVLMFGADVRFAFGVPAAPIKPFVLGGGGLAHVKVGESTIGSITIPSASENKFYYNIGGGVEFNAGSTLKLFVQARYVGFKADEENYAFIPVSVGLKF